MKIYLIGNYPLDETTSMFLYTDLLKKYLKNFNHQIIILRPNIILNKCNIKNQLIKKYLSYIDKYFFFGIKLFFKIGRNDIAHIADQANSVLYPFIRTKKLSITCHDLINIKLLKNDKIKKLSFTGRIYQNLIHFFIKRFKKIISVSQKTKKDLIKISKINKSKIYLIYNSLNKNLKYLNPLKSKKILKDQVNNKFFLHVGGNAWYKNKEGLIRIFNEFVKLNNDYNKYKLVIAGAKLSKNLIILIRQLKLENDIINLVNPNDNLISALYSSAEGLIFPSYDEGFGWPIIEAQKCRCPVFTTNKNPMKEIGKNGVFYLNISNNVKNAIIIKKGIKLKKKIIKKGLNNLKRFNFNKTKKEYIIFFKNQCNNL